MAGIWALNTSSWLSPAYVFVPNPHTHPHPPPSVSLARQWGVTPFDGPYYDRLSRDHAYLRLPSLGFFTLCLTLVARDGLGWVGFDRPNAVTWMAVVRCPMATFRPPETVANNEIPKLLDTRSPKYDDGVEEKMVNLWANYVEAGEAHFDPYDKSSTHDPSY